MKTDKRDTVGVFRERLKEVITRSGLNRSRFAEAVGFERSTLTQLLSEKAVRLPRIETLVAIAASQQVSLDWLLGLSQQDDVATEVVPSLEVAEGAWSPADERLSAWHQEATGYKIRYVPSTLPDLLKSDEVIRYEHGMVASSAPDIRMAEAADRLANSRRSDSEMEVCSSFQIIDGFARGEGIWADLPDDARKQQLSRMADLLDELYPTFRWFLFDALKVYSAPYTVFGPNRAIIYMGEIYFVFNATEHIRILTRHFDGLIRHAIVQPPDASGYIRSLIHD